jgi:hypothetical protein
LDCFLPALQAGFAHNLPFSHFSQLISAHPVSPNWEILAYTFCLKSDDCDFCSAVRPWFSTGFFTDASITLPKLRYSVRGLPLALNGCGE